ncbi:PAN domain-containing protein [Apostasia shenzhenica]|uniref:PAN domain-containing protein n=1 Tax=Apostasia shenzhenica TaxID=1088818 RepID=A0A2I0B912_9ASPA|nr:PAN domain-containing protein [Apostasia shenzhenica]
MSSSKVRQLLRLPKTVITALFFRLFFFDLHLARSSNFDLSAMEKNNLSALLSVLTLFTALKAAAAFSSSQIGRGFSANLDQSSGPFQPLLADPSGVFSLGFLQFNSSKLDLAVVHLPSGRPTWLASPAAPAPWSSSACFSFNGSLLLSDRKTGAVVWSTTTTGGDRLRLLNSSNLQIVKLTEPISVLWQTFDFPSDTIVQGQNFTSTAVIFSSNRRFSMSLGSNYLALFMEFSQGVEKAMYWKRRALQANNQIVAGEGPIYGRVDPNGFLGLYQKEGVPVDVIPFDSFSRGITSLRRLTLEDDGNLRGYFWNGKVWVSDFSAISELCDLPSACGAYGLCQPGKQQCGCIDQDLPKGCPPPDSGYLCQSDGGFRVIRRKGIDLANKDLLISYKMKTLEDCEASCERNCSCWGAAYNNATGYCYRMNYPVHTVVGVVDERRTGYFKVRNPAAGGGGGGNKGRKTAQALLVVGMSVAAAGAGIGAYRLYWRGKRRKEARAGSSMTEVLAPGPYKNLRSGSFGSIELAYSFRK